jgi:hypothetical protein
MFGSTVVAVLQTPKAKAGKFHADRPSNSDLPSHAVISCTSWKSSIQVFYLFLFHLFIY